MVASSALHSFNPYTITFGAPQALQPGCSTLYWKRHFRFVLTGKATLGYWGYDFASALDVPHCHHYGREILLGPVTSSVLIGDGRRRDPPIAELHSIDQYYIPRLLQMNGLQVPGNGWGRGNQCAYNEECSHGHCAKYLGAGVCCHHHEYNDLGSCKGKVEKWSPCVEDRVCQSGRCCGLCC